VETAQALVVVVLVGLELVLD